MKAQGWKPILVQIVYVIGAIVVLAIIAYFMLLISGMIGPAEKIPIAGLSW